MRGLNTYNKFQRELASCGVKKGANHGVNHAEELASCRVKEGANEGVNHAERILHVVPCSN